MRCNQCKFQPPNSPYNAGFTAHEIELEQKKKIETLKHQQKESEEAALQKKEPILKSKNVSGPPVYYPPGHEMFAKKEESGAWRAEVRFKKILIITIILIKKQLKIIFFLGRLRKSFWQI